MERLTLALGVFLVVRTVTSERLFERPREWLQLQYRKHHNDSRWYMHIIALLCYMPTCAFCLGFWVSFVFCVLTPSESGDVIRLNPITKLPFAHHPDLVTRETLLSVCWVWALALMIGRGYSILASIASIREHLLKRFGCKGCGHETANSDDTELKLVV